MLPLVGEIQFLLKGAGPFVSFVFCKLLPELLDLIDDFVGIVFQVAPIQPDGVVLASLFRLFICPDVDIVTAIIITLQIGVFVQDVGKDFVDFVNPFPSFFFVVVYSADFDDSILSTGEMLADVGFEGAEPSETLHGCIDFFFAVYVFHIFYLLIQASRWGLSRIPKRFGGVFLPQ